MKNVIFIAPPAAGKGTLSDYLETNLHYEHISTGELFREKVKENNEEAEVLKDIIASGKLVSDEILFHLLELRLQNLDKRKNFILEGLPRTLQQAENLDIILRDLGFSDYIVINIEIDELVLQKRMTGRRICPTCRSTYNIYFEKFKPHQELTCDKCASRLIERDDDTLESFQVRYQIFLEHITPIVEYYQEKNLIVGLNNTNENNDSVIKDLRRIVGAEID